MNLAESLGFVPQRTTRAVRAINVEKLIPNPDNFYHIGDLSELKASIMEDGGVRQNLIVEPQKDGTYLIISGHRRCQAVKELLADGADVEADLPCEIEPDHAKAERLMIRANSAARILTPWEEVLQAQRADELITRQRHEGLINEPKRQAMQKLLHKSSGSIGRLCAIYNNLVVDLQQKMKDGKLGVSAAYEICQLRPEDQEGLLATHNTFGIEEITLADVRHYKDMNGVGVCRDDPRQTTIMDFIDDEPKEAAVPAKAPETPETPTAPAAVPPEETPPVEAEPEDDYMDDEYRQLMKAHRTVADSAYARLHKLWTIYNKYNDGNITEDKYINDTQYECHEMYRELDHLRVIDEQMKKKRGKD
ncbi:ParB/RepB/Spo0J family partition protein [Megasphaera elsdenii]|uniref:ParB/RepB/Spo0J family partition protein n=1 Tax=Megasphaera elsdenii TaxID=907 RepID=UPI0006C804EB|nr:ParB/RepB/Spo0J family partition protein [Megasphaera elsdenii]